MSDKDQSGGLNIENSGDVNIGQDAVGRDKIITTQTTHVEGGPVARYAVVGVVAIAALAIIIIALLASRGAAPIATATPTQTAAFIPKATQTDTPPPPNTVTPTQVLLLPTDTPEPPTPTPTIGPTFTPAPTETPTLPPGVTPSPTSALALYDDFGDNCLNASRWALAATPNGPEAPTPIPVSGDCLQAQRQFFTEGRNGHLTVFVTVEGDQTHSLVESSNACYAQAEVTLALDDVTILSEETHIAYLSVGLALTRISGDGFIEVRLEGVNSGRNVSPEITARWTNAAGYTTLASRPYTFQQPVTVAFRIGEVGVDGPASASQRLVITINGEPLVSRFSMLTACGLTLGYHADSPASLDGYFDEVRLSSEE